MSVTLTGSTHSLAITDGAASDGRNRVLLFSGSPGANCTVTVTPNDAEKWYFVYNGTSGGFSVIMAQGGGSGSTVTVANGYWALVRLDGTGSNANVTRLLDSWEVTTALKAATYTSASTLSIKPGADSTAAIRLQNSSGTQVAVIDSTNSRFGVGSIAPTSTFSVSGANSITAPANTGIHLIGDSVTVQPRISIDGVNNAGWFLGRLCLGTASSPSACGPGSFLAAFTGRGYLSTAYSTNDLARVAIQGEEWFTDSSAATGISFWTTPIGAVASQNVARIDNAGRFIVGGSTVASGSSAGIELQSTTTALLLSRMTTTQRDAMTPINGMVIYNTTTNKFQGYQAGAWVDFV